VITAPLSKSEDYRRHIKGVNKKKLMNVEPYTAQPKLNRYANGFKTSTFF
jgi:hypothetical protein